MTTPRTSVAHRRRSARRAGMTLMELVIALALVAILVTAGGAAFGQIIDRQETMRTASTEMERAAALRETIRQWILQGEIQVQRGGGPAGTRSSVTMGRAGTTVSVFRGAQAAPTAQGVTAATSTGNEFSVVTNAPNPLMAPNVRIRIFVDADDNTPEQGLTIEYQASARTPLMRRELDPTVGDLVVEFFDRRMGRWIPSTEAATGQLIAVRLSMVPAEGVAMPRLLELPVTIVFGEVAP